MSAKKCIAVMVLLAAVGGFLFAGNTASAREPVTVEYYYYDPCES